MSMKKITIVFRTGKLEDLKDFLFKNKIQGATMTEVKGFGKQMGNRDLLNDEIKGIKFVEKLKIEIVVKDNTVDKIRDKLVQALRTGRIGDGKIFISGIDEAIRIRTGESGEFAL